MNKKKMKVVCIGGGTGTFVVLKGLKNYTLDISAIVTMSDSGGSNKRIIDEFGLLPTSDIRQCFVALSDENGGAGLLRNLFMYRYEKGKGIRGMTFGNLFMAALSDILGSQKEAIKKTGKVLRIKGKVIPVSYTKTNLIAEYEDGTKKKQEHLIDEPEHDGRLKIKKIYLQPKAVPNQDALTAIKKADMIVLGPGDLYTSLIPNLLVDEVSQTIVKSKAKKVYIVNLMTKYGQTYNLSAKDHVTVLSEFIKNSINYVILNNFKFDENVLDIYKKYHEFPVRDNLNNNNYKVIRAAVASASMIKKSKSDNLTRSLIRHDSEKLGSLLMQILENKL